MVEPRQKWEEKEAEKVCCIDIDGVLNYYPDCWVEYLNAKSDTKFADLQEAKNTITFANYKKWKKEYRTSGELAKEKVRKNVGVFLHALRADGYKVILLTARPYQQHREIMKFTLEWLAKHSLPYDDILWDKEKHAKIILEVPHLKFMVEDNRYIANMVAKLGYKVYLMDNVYNQGNLLPQVSRIKNFNEILDDLKHFGLGE